MSAPGPSVAPGYFDAMYAANPDPWAFATSRYERDKYAATLAALPPATFDAALEVGCSIGIFTRRLALRCHHLLAIDGSAPALVEARRHCTDARVTFEHRLVPAEWPPGHFDLIVFSEVLYYLGEVDLHATAQRAAAALVPGGTVLLVHYLGHTGAPLDGTQAALGFIAGCGLPVRDSQATDAYRIDVLG